MNAVRSPLRALAYFIIGLIVLIAAVWILRVVFHIITWLACLALTIALIFVVGYFVYCLVKAAVKSL